MARKIKEIREIDSKVKIIRELGGDDEINFEEEGAILPESEDFSDFVGGETSGGFGFSSEPQDFSDSINMEESVENISAPSREDIRGDMGTDREFRYTTIAGGSVVSSEPEYKPTEEIRTDRIREASVGRRFAMDVGESDLPEAHAMGQNITARMREEAHERAIEDRQNKYDTGGGERKRRAGPWE